MADAPKVLGQSIPAAGTLTTLYTVPGATSTVVSTLMACNQSLAATVIRVSIAVAGAADTAKQYVYYDLPLAGLDTFAVTAGWALATTDLIRVQAANGNVSFNLFGVEIT
jgi:hypothetical protein